MGPLDEYMSLFSQADQRGGAPTSDRSTEQDLNGDVPEMTGYLESVTLAPNQQRVAAPAPTYAPPPVRSGGDYAARMPARPKTSTARATKAPLFSLSPAPAPAPRAASRKYMAGGVRTAEAAGGSPPSTSPSAGAPLPLPPDAPPPAAPPPDTTFVPPGANYPPPPAEAKTSPDTRMPDAGVSPDAPRAVGSGNGKMLLVAAALVAGAWWLFKPSDEDEKKRRAQARP